MEVSNFFMLGPSDVGKTEYGLRLISSNGTSRGTTDYFNLFSTKLNSFFPDSGLFHLAKDPDPVSAMLWDFAGQITDIYNVGPYLPRCNGGLIYAVDSLNPDIDKVAYIDSFITKEFKNINIPKPPVSIYVSKSMVKSSNNRRLTDYLTKDYYNKNNTESLAHISSEGFKRQADLVSNLLNLCGKYNAALLAGDAIGASSVSAVVKKSSKKSSALKLKPYVEEQVTISPIMYILRTFNKVLPSPIEVDFHAVMNSSIILKKAENPRFARGLEKILFEDLKSAGVV